MDVSARQMVSVAAAFIPFLEHDDANRALMGANMQRQAVPLLTTEAPLVGTGMELRAAHDSGEMILAAHSGVVSEVSADLIVVSTDEGGRDSYRLEKFERSNPGNCTNQRVIVDEGRPRRGRRRPWPTAPPPPTARSRSARTCSSPTCRGKASTTRTPSS